MSFIYEQSTGKMKRNGTLVGLGYSGNGAGKNNALAQDIPNVGPIPQGIYAIGAPYNSVKHGPFALPLAPDAANLMFGRSGFLCHGDSIESPGCASEGCIIMPKATREAMWNSGDRELEVIAGDEFAPTDPEMGQ
jgi:hypothetical protein